VPAWWLAGAAVLALFMVAVSAFAWTQPHAAPSGPARVLVQSVSGDPEESARAAQSAAERAIGPILSYDYRHLDEDRAAAQSYMTSSYRSRDYDPLFEVVKQNAPGSKAVVKAEVVGSGIVRSGEDRVEVLLFVNRPTTNKKNSEPVVYKDQVRAQMVKVDGEWLVDCLLTSPNGHCD
jgi:Mce-associated membrane protein